MAFYEENSKHFHNQNPQNPQACIDLIKEYPSITYLNHESAHVHLKREDGPRTSFKVFGSPFSPAHGLWAFAYPPKQAPFLWDQIPLDTDIVVTHTPPKYHCDESKHTKASGCKALRETLWRVRPLLAICGHVHEGRGAERIVWDLACPNVKYKERATAYWTDPSLGVGNRKQCHLDLSAKSLAPLNGTGPWIDASDGTNCDGPAETAENRLSVRESIHSLAWTSATSKSNVSAEGTQSPALDMQLPLHQGPDDASKATTSVFGDSENHASKSEYSSEENHSSDFGQSHHVAEDRRRASAYASLEIATHSAARGQGGSPPSGRCDLEALAGRRGRQETCVINASIMASSWPYKFKDNRKYNKPIIVDVDLPVGQESE